MSIFDKLFKGQKNKQPAAIPAVADRPKPSPVVKPSSQPPCEHTSFSEDDIGRIVCNYIDEKGLDSLSKEETELVKPFVISLFYYYHDNAVKNDHSSYCDRNGCDLRKNEPVFLTASKVLCKNCALQYILGNLHNWYYYLGNLSAAIGAVPSHYQIKGKALQKRISDLRKQKLFEQLETMTEEEKYKFVMDTEQDTDQRAEAVLKMSDAKLVNQIALEATAYPVLTNTLSFPLPRETVIKLANQRMNNEYANKLRAKATEKLNEADLEAVVLGKISGAIFVAIERIDNKEFLEKYIQTADSMECKERAQKRLATLKSE